MTTDTTTIATGLLLDVQLILSEVTARPRAVAEIERNLEAAGFPPGMVADTLRGVMAVVPGGPDGKSPAADEPEPDGAVAFAELCQRLGIE